MKRRAQSATFAEIVRDTPVYGAPPAQVKRLGDPQRRGWRKVADDISPEEALRLVQAGAEVAWDFCGSEGYAADLMWLGRADVEQLAASGPPILHRTKSNYAELSEWATDDGQRLVLATLSVSWGDLLDRRVG